MHWISTRQFQSPVHSGGNVGGNVGRDLAGAVVVGGQVAIDRCHPAGRPRAGVAAEAVSGGVCRGPHRLLG